MMRPGTVGRLGRLGLVAAAVRGAFAPFSPASLFANGERGLWYDVSDFSTLFQDAAGTIPVTAVEQPVGLILDKSGRGNHASQPTTTARAVLRSRYNLLTHSEDFSNTFWAGSQFLTRTQNALETLSPSGLFNAAKITGTTSTNTHRLLVATTIAGVGHKLVIHAKKAELKRIGLLLGTPFGGAWFDLEAGTSGPLTDQPAITSHSITAVANGFYRCEVIVPITTVTGNGCQVFLLPNNGASFSASNFACDGQGVYVWGADLRPANLPASLPPYQRIAAATDYDTVGFPVYLDIDGTDDNYVTGSIDFSGTDKMTVWAGLRKLDDTAQILCELSANVAGSAGSFYVVTGIDNLGAPRYSTISRGSAGASINITARFAENLYPAPDNAVISATHDIAGDLSRIRRNGSSAGAIDGTGDKGTGNFGNYPLYLFSRGGTAARWKGQFYGLIVRGAATDTAQLEQTEQWINARMGGIY